MSRIFEITAKDETAKALEKWEEPAGEDLDLIEQTRRAVAQLSERQRFQRAKIHLEHALKYKNPRIDIFSESQSLPYKIAYSIQTSFIWQLVVQILSFVYMYLIVFADGSNAYLYTTGSAYALGIFWVDLLMELLHSSRDGVRKSSRYPMLVYVKAIILTVLVVQQILVAQQVSNSQGRPLNPLRVLRAILPLVYVSEVRRSFQALLSAYEEFLVFVVFDFLVVVGFALIGSIIIQVPQDTVVDQFTSNYDDLGHMIFITYVAGSYDAFPDNQMVAFSISKWFEAFFIVFVFLNMFLFSSIPGSLLFDSYISTRSKYILIDEIKMQHSLILAFISLGQHNYEINIKTIISFFHFLYQDRVRYIDAITELCIKLNDDGNCSVVLMMLFSMFWNLYNWVVFYKKILI